MKKLNVYDLDGKKLFTGTREDVKHYVRSHKIRHYTLKESFDEKVVEIEDKKAITSEKDFNEIFA